MNNKTAYSIFVIVLLLSVFVKNIAFILPFHIWFASLFLMSAVLQPKQIKFKPTAYLIFFLTLMLTAFIARDFDGLGSEIHILIYFLFILPFFIFTTTSHLSHAEQFGKISTVFFITLNLVGILAYLFAIATKDHSELVILFNGEASDSRKILINSLESFVFADTWGYRYSGFYLDPNRWSFCLIFMYMFSDTYTAQSKKLQSISKGLILLSLVLTFSKGGYFGLITYLTIRAMMERKAASLVYFTAIPLAIFMFIFAFSDTSQILERAIYGFDSENGKSRLNTWPAYFYQITKDPTSLMFGVFTDADLTKTMPINPHNLPLFITYQFGLAFFFFFVASIISLYRKAKNLKHKNRVFLVSGLISLGIMTLTEDEVLLPIFWFAGAFIYSNVKNTNCDMKARLRHSKEIETR